MEITNIEQKNNIFIVSFKPDWLEKLFGNKKKDVRYKQTGNTYLAGSGNVYIREDGVKLDNGDYVGTAMDEYQRKLNF